MARRNRGIYITLALAIIGSIIIGWVIWPKPQELPTFKYEGARRSDYHAGGTGCLPDVLSALGKGQEATRQRDACAEEAEKYRLQTNDLIQQTRAAGAAGAQAELAAQAAWTIFFQTIGGFLTLVAATAAASYARDAAAETRRAANAAEESNKYSELSNLASIEAARASSIALTSGRAWMVNNHIEAGISQNIAIGELRAEEALVLVVPWYNSGQTPAIVESAQIRYYWRLYGGAPDKNTLWPDEKQFQIIGPGSALMSQEIKLSGDDVAEFRSRNYSIYIHGRIIYYDVYSDRSDPASFHETSFAFRGDYEQSFVATDGRRTEKIIYTAMSEFSVVT